MWKRSTRSRLLAGLGSVSLVCVVLMCLVTQLAGCATSRAGQHRWPAGVTSTGLYAFLHAGGGASPARFSVGRGDQVLYSTDVGFWPEPDVQWTTDGRIAFAVVWPISPADPTKTDYGAPKQIVSIDAASGRASKRPCSCGTAAAVGASDAVWVDRDGKINRVDLAADLTTAPRLVSVRLPASASALQALTGTTDSFLLATGGAKDGASLPGGLFQVGAGGDATRLAKLDRLHSASVAAVHGAGRRTQVLYSVIEGWGDCPHPGPVTIIRAGTQPGATDTGSVADGDYDEIMASDVWWAADGAPHATLTSLYCTQKGAKAQPAAAWELVGNTWTRDEDGVMSFRELNADSRVVLTSTGDLMLQISESQTKASQTKASRTRIRGDVGAIEVPPRM